MRVVVAALLAALCVPALPASALSGPPGARCGFEEDGTRPQSEEWTLRSGSLSGGPLAGTGTLTCTIQVDAPTHGTTANDAASASATGTGVVVLPPTYVTFDVPLGSSYVLCTAFTPEGGAPLYWDGAGRRWTTDANVPCEPEPVCEDCVGDVLRLFEAVDPVVCPVLGGDVTGVWDCPPYGD